MALENINCPQFVDFESNDAFNIHDGADLCFGECPGPLLRSESARFGERVSVVVPEKGVVGELDLGDFGMGSCSKEEEARRDSGEMERLIAVLKSKFGEGCGVFGVPMRLD